MMKSARILQGLEYCTWKGGISSAFCPCCSLLEELPILFPHLCRHMTSYLCPPLPAVWLLDDVIFVGLCSYAFTLSSQENVHLLVPASQGWWLPPRCF